MKTECSWFNTTISVRIGFPGFYDVILSLPASLFNRLNLRDLKQQLPNVYRNILMTWKKWLRNTISSPKTSTIWTKVVMLLEKSRQPDALSTPISDNSFKAN